MIIYPTLEIKAGKAVSLTRGRLNEPVIWHVDPLATAKSFAQAGAEWMHITDIDALSGLPGNDDLINEIIRAVGIPVQLGGGFRSRERVEHWIDRGAGRIVISTMASHDPDLFAQLVRLHPDQIVLAVDVYQGYVMTEGWQKYSAFRPQDYIAAFEDLPLAAVIITDIDADIEDQDGQLGLITGLAAKTRHQVIARGTVSTVDDVARLKYVPNVAGTLIGRALMARNVDLKEALRTARPELGLQAEFI